jgi:hypothetical protein
MTASGVSALERGHRRRPYAHTVRSLAAALALPEADRNALFAATRRPAGLPTPTSQAARPGNLPLRLTSFIGREHESADLAHRVGATRVLTMTGPGGVGKTRLALEVAADLAIDFPDGLWFVDLAPVAHPDLVPQTTATTLGSASVSASSEFRFRCIGDSNPGPLPARDVVHLAPGALQASCEMPSWGTRPYRHPEFG